MGLNGEDNDWRRGWGEDGELIPLEEPTPPWYVLLRRGGGEFDSNDPPEPLLLCTEVGLTAYIQMRVL